MTAQVSYATSCSQLLLSLDSQIGNLAWSSPFPEQKTVFQWQWHHLPSLEFTLREKKKKLVLREWTSQRGTFLLVYLKAPKCSADQAPRWAEPRTLNTKICYLGSGVANALLRTPMIPWRTICIKIHCIFIILLCRYSVAFSTCKKFPGLADWRSSQPVYTWKKSSKVKTWVMN